MKNRLSLSILVFSGLVATSQLAFAAAPVVEPSSTSLVSALQAVSPDPLGGRLGLAITSGREAGIAPATGSSSLAMKSPRAEADQRAYRIWKNSQKS